MADYNHKDELQHLEKINEVSPFDKLHLVFIGSSF